METKGPSMFFVAKLRYPTINTNYGFFFGRVWILNVSIFLEELV
jgi:hypothetical protein